METLKEKFEALTHRIQSSGKPAAAWFPQFTPVTLLNAEKWWEALAVCEYALDTHEDEALTAGFFELIFSAYDCNVEVDLNEEEYAYWWEKVISVCDRVAVFNGAGWSQKGAQYSEARYGKRDLSLLFPCYEKAAEMGSPEAEATVAYWRYMGFYCEQDRAEGERRFAALSSPEALLWGKYYRAYAEQHTGSKEKALLMRKELLDELPEGHRLRAHVYAAMGDALDIEEGSVAEEAACYEKSLELVPNLYSLKNLATLYFRYPELGKQKELAFELWEKAWHAGVWSAANFLGYNYQEEEWLDMPKAIEWLEKGMLYCESYCAYELALIYLYNDEYKNVERGLMCLQRCVDDNYVEAIETLANVYFNGDWWKRISRMPVSCWRELSSWGPVVQPIVSAGCMSVDCFLKNRIIRRLWSIMKKLCLWTVLTGMHGRLFIWLMVIPELRMPGSQRPIMKKRQSWVHVLQW